MRLAPADTAGAKKKSVRPTQGAAPSGEARPPCESAFAA